jgi:putative heme-binding domain-containing protein
MFRGVLGAMTGWTAALLVASAAPAAFQNPTPSTAGAELYAARCADCHGADATGARGPDLTRLWGAGATDERVFHTIRQGVPGSIMSASTAPDEEVRALVAYLKALGTAGAGTAGAGTAGTGMGARGSAAHGERAFWSTCGGCHRVGQRGGRLGPDLTRIGVTQSGAVLRAAIRQASASITPGYRSLTLVTRDGVRVRGVRKGEDAFSVQILDTRERLQGYLKADLARVDRDAQSLMPDYGPDRLSEADLDDLVAFLTAQKGSK